VVRASPDCNATTLAVNGVSGFADSRNPNCPQRATALFGVMSTAAAPIWNSAPLARTGKTSQASNTLQTLVKTTLTEELFMAGTFRNEWL